MIGLSILATVAPMLQPMTLHCDTRNEDELSTVPGEHGWDARISLVPKLSSYKVALIDGRPLFSGETGPSLSPRSSGRVSAGRSMRGTPWTVDRFGDVVQLRRGDSKIELAKESDVQGGYTGTWSMHEAVRNITFEGTWQVICRTLDKVAPTVWDNYEP